MTHTVLLANEDPGFREELAEAIERAPSLELVGRAENAADAVEASRVEQPDVAVVDVAMRDGGGPRVARELQAVAPGTMVLALAAYGDEAAVMQMLDAGAAGYLLKGIPAGDLIGAIERAAGHRSLVAADATDAPDRQLAGPTKVIIADDDNEALAALASIIDRAPDFALVGKARDATTAMRLAALYTPDLALVDAWMPGGGGSFAAAQIRRGSPTTHVIALSASPERDIVLRMLHAGASSYVVKSVPAQDLLTALRATAAADHAEMLVRLEAAETRAGPVDDPSARLREVIDGSALRMVFQPIVDIQGKGVVGVEALARFDCEPRQSPDVWFMDAVASGLGVEMDLAAARQAVAVLPHLPPDLDLFMNVVPETLFSPGFEDLVSTVPGSRVVLELTEHAPVHDYDRLAEAIGALRAEGFRIAVDDVGAGYSSFRHLLTVHPDVLKIDISLCRSIETDRARQVIAASIASLGRELDAMVVAEGIETPAELSTVRELGIDSAQGFFMARPGRPPLDELLAAAASNGAPH